MILILKKTDSAEKKAKNSEAEDGANDEYKDITEDNNEEAEMENNDESNQNHDELNESYETIDLPKDNKKWANIKNPYFITKTVAGEPSTGLGFEQYFKRKTDNTRLTLGYFAQGSVTHVVKGSTIQTGVIINM